MRGDRVYDLVVVPALDADALIVQTDVAVGVDAAGSHQTAFCIDYLRAFGHGQICANGHDLAVLQQHIAAGQVGGIHRLDISVLNQNHCCDPFCGAAGFLLLARCMA